MRFEMTRTFPVPRQQGWDFVEDFHTWPDWLNVDIVDPEEAARSKPGDTVKVAGKMLGMRFPGELVLEETTAPEMSRTLWRWPGWPDVHVEQHYSHAGPGAFTLRLVAYVDEDAGLMGRPTGWLMANVPFMMRREIHSDFDRLDAVLRSGVTKKHAPAKSRRKAAA